MRYLTLLEEMDDLYNLNDYPNEEVEIHTPGDSRFIIEDVRLIDGKIVIIARFK